MNVTGFYDLFYIEEFDGLSALEFFFGSAFICFDIFDGRPECELREKINGKRIRHSLRRSTICLPRNVAYSGCKSHATKSRHKLPWMKTILSHICLFWSQFNASTERWKSHQVDTEGDQWICSSWDHGKNQACTTESSHFSNISPINCKSASTSPPSVYSLLTQHKARKDGGRWHVTNGLFCKSLKHFAKAATESPNSLLLQVVMYTGSQTTQDQGQQEAQVRQGAQGQQGGKFHMAYGQAPPAP